jgi:hypothetical protein
LSQIANAPELHEVPKQEQDALPTVSAAASEVQQPSQDQVVTTGDSAHLPAVKDEDEDDVADQLSKFPPSVLVATKLLIGSWVCL